jgi:hypothetical protein
MASAADVIFAQFRVDENNRLLEAARKARKSLQNRRNKMGIGRMLGAVGGGLLGLALAPVTGGASLAAAIGAGVGSRVGSEAGTRGAFGDASVSDITVGKLNQEKARAMQSDVVQAERGLNRSANVNMLSDAFSAYTLAGTGIGKGVQQSIKTGSFNPLKQAMNPGVFNTGSAGVSIDDLNQGVIDKYGQNMIQPRPGAAILNTNAIAGPPVASASVNATTGSAVGIDNTIKAMEDSGSLVASSPTSQTIPVGEIQGPSINLANQTALDVATNPYFGPYEVGAYQAPTNFALNPETMGYTGTLNQNMQLAEMLDLNPNRSIVDQLKGMGVDSSVDARRRMYSDYFGGF